ncbi:MAG: hypothetical protein Q9213_005721 [Squamulea squamosa]
MPMMTNVELILRSAVLQNIAQFEVPSQDKANPRDVVIYCDTSRLIERKTQEDGETVTRMYDPDIDMAEEKAHSIINECGTAISGTAMAFTVGQRRADKIQQIQICPWYMNYVASVEYGLMQTNTLKGWIARAANLVPRGLAD